MTGRIVAEVCGLIAQREHCQAARRRIWTLPGAPLIGIVSADDRAHWDALGRHAAYLDQQINNLRAVLA